MKQGPRVCVRVPGPRDSRRGAYEAMEEETRREEWIALVLGGNGVYVGRPKNDGGWFKAERIKAGSLFANPFPVKDYGLDDSLARYRVFLARRLDPKCTVEALVDLLPIKDAELARHFFLLRDGKGRSMRHLELNVLGVEFQARLQALRGKRLGCFCDLTEPCHVDVMLEAMHE